MRRSPVLIVALLACLTWAPTASAYRAPTAQERAELAVAAEWYFEHQDPSEPPPLHIVRIRISTRDQEFASSGTEGPAVTPFLFYGRNPGGEWEVIGGSSGCVYAKELEMPGAVALELGACSPEFYVEFGTTPQRHPRVLDLGNWSMFGMQWRRWERPVAIGSGTYPSDNCSPDCAEGKITDYPVKVWLSQARECQRDALRYTNLRYRLPRRAPGPSVHWETINCQGRLIGWGPR